MSHAIIAWERTPTNISLARAADWLLLDPVRALKVLRSGDVALARLDVWTALAETAVAVTNGPMSIVDDDLAATSTVCRTGAAPSLANNESRACSAVWLGLEMIT